MSESNLHKLLKKIGMAWLYNQQCFMVADEIYVYKDYGERHELDNHYFMDVVGVGKKFIPYIERTDINESYSSILRGIEVKVSRSDFKNGFCTTGCNYHYLLTPMRLVNKAELPKWVGLIEYNKYKYKIRYLETGKFDIQGIRVVKKPRFRELSDYQLLRATRSVGAQLSSLVKTNLVELLCRSSNKTGDKVEP